MRLARARWLIDNDNYNDNVTKCVTKFIFWSVEWAVNRRRRFVATNPRHDDCCIRFRSLPG